MLRIQLGVKRKSTQLNLVPSFVPRAGRKGNFKGSGLTRKQYKQAQAQAAKSKAKAAANRKAAGAGIKSGPKAKKTVKLINDVKVSELEKMQPSSKVRSAIATARKLELSAGGVMHSLAPWLDASGKLGWTYLLAKRSKKTTNDFVGQEIGFSNETTTYHHTMSLGDSRKMPSSKVTIENKVPIYDSNWRDKANMNSGFFKAEAFSKIQSGLGLTSNRFFGAPIQERQLRRIKTPSATFRNTAFSCIDTGASTYFDPVPATRSQNIVYNAWCTDDVITATNISRLTSCVIDFHLVQILTTKDDDTNNPYNSVSQAINNIPVDYVPTEYGTPVTLKKYVQGSTHKGFGQVHDTSLGAIEWKTLQDYTLKSDSKMSDTINYIKSVTQVLGPGDCAKFEVKQWMNVDLTQRGPISQYPLSEDEALENYGIIMSIRGQDINAYNCKADANGNIVSRKYIRRNSTASVSLRREVNYVDYSLRNVNDSLQNPEVNPTLGSSNLYTTAYRRKPEIDDIHKGIYAIYADVIDSEDDVPANSGDKFIIPVSTRTQLVGSSKADLEE